MLDGELAGQGFRGSIRYQGIDTKVSTLPLALPGCARRTSAMQMVMTIAGSTLNIYAKALQRKEISESYSRFYLPGPYKHAAASGKGAARLRQFVTQMVTLEFAGH